MSTPKSDSIAGRSVRGASWLFVRRIAANVIRLAAMAVLARRLSAADFGLAALAQVLLAFSVLSGELGVGAYVIADRDVGCEERAHSAFWLGLLMTAGQLLIFALLSPVIAHIFKQPELPSVLGVLAIAFAFRQLSAIPDALMRRRLEYGPLVARDAASDFLTAIVSLVMAIQGFGVWSLVIPQAVVEPLRAVTSFWVAHWRPRWSRHHPEWRRIVAYSLHLVGTNLLVLAANDGDTLLVGKLLGATALGFYDLAYQLSNVIGNNVTGVVSNVALSAFAAVSTDRERLRRGYVRVLRLLACIGFPALFGLFVLAPDAIAVLYGPRWALSAIMLRLFIVFTSVRIVTSPCAMIFNVVGRPDIGWKYNVFFVPAYAAAIVIGSRWGVVGVAAGVTAVRFVGAIVPFWISTWLIDLSVIAAVAALGAICLAALMMAGTVWGLHAWLLTTRIVPVTRLAVSIAVGSVAYFAYLAMLDRAVMQEALGLMRTLRPRSAPRSAAPAPDSAPTHA